MVEEVITYQASTPSSRSNEGPHRILPELDENAGTLQGVFAQSSDVIAFRQIGNKSSRQISTYELTGTRDGSRIRLSFSTGAGIVFEVDTRIDEQKIAGSYVAQPSIGLARETSSGRFEIERF